MQKECPRIARLFDLQEGEADVHDTDLGSLSKSPE